MRCHWEGLAEAVTSSLGVESGLNLGLGATLFALDGQLIRIRKQMPRQAPIRRGTPGLGRGYPWGNPIIDRQANRRSRRAPSCKGDSLDLKWPEHCFRFD